MEYQVEDIVRDVKVAIDENMNSTPLISIGEINSLSLESLIESKVQDGVMQVLMSAPVRMVDGGVPITSEVVWDSEGTGGYVSGHIGLPSDFMRLVSFKMTDWSIPVFYPITPDSPLYPMQKSRFGGIKGNPEKPVCAIVPGGSGSVLEFFSCKGRSSSVEAASYLPIPKVEEDAISIPQMCYRPSVYMIAALTKESLREHDFAEVMKNETKIMLEQ